MRYLPIAALLLFALGACSEPPPPPSDAPAAPPQSTDAGDAPPPAQYTLLPTTIVISDSGSADTVGWRIVIVASGEARYISGDGRGHAALPAELFAKLKTDIDAAKPLSALHGEAACTKLAGSSSTYIAMAGERSSDLSCPGTPVEVALKADIDAIVAFLKLRNTPRNQGKDLPPQNQ
jgi:hypothetical protein